MMPTGLPFRMFLSGTCAAILSTAALAAFSRRETGSPYAGVNAVSHWVWGRNALYRNRLTASHTGLGFLTHHGASIFWAALFELLRTRGRRGPRGTIAAAATTAAIANVVDFRVVPERLTPGFQHRISRTALFGVYLAFGVGLAAAGLCTARRPRQAR